MNKRSCLPYEEALLEEIRQIFPRAPGNNHYVGNPELQNIPATQQRQVNQFQSHTKSHFRDVLIYAEL